MLIVLAGLPGVGKTAIARELAQLLGAVHVCVDAIELAIRESGVRNAPADDAGYRAGCAVAEDNLRLGRTVIADAVNPLPGMRDAWLQVAKRASVPVVEIEVECSDVREHRRRVEERLKAAAAGPTWDQVVAHEYDPWERPHLVVDTAGRTAEQSVALLQADLRRRSG